MKKRLFLGVSILIMMLMTAVSASAQTAVKWNATAKMTSETEGVITITAEVAPGWHLYAFNQPEDGPQPIKFTMSASKGVKLFGSLKYSPKATSQMEEMFGATVSFWSKSLKLTRQFRLEGVDNGTATVTVKYMACNDQMCLPPTTETLTVNIK